MVKYIYVLSLTLILSFKNKGKGYKIMKKIWSLMIIITILLPFCCVNTYSEDNDSYFIVTAYYSPLPWQESYLAWDYDSEIKLNGWWIKWASWKWVFSWMLAWPKNYDFWTKIYLEWLWIWEISDRWWAIVNAGNRWYEYDRIDVWMWSGDEWLKRALYWGKRKVKWYITDSSLSVTLDNKKIASPDWATNWLKKIWNIFNIWLWKWSDIWMVKKLQTLLKDFWLYNGELDWTYNNKVIDVVYDFQLNNEIVKSPKDFGAGYWGKNTRDLFLKEYLDWDFDKVVTEKPLLSTGWPKGLILSPYQEKEATKIEKVEVVNNLAIFDNSISGKDNIIKLQNILKEMSLYKWESTGDIKDIIDTLYDYQISKWIVNSIASPWAWTFWPKTRAALKVSYKEYLDKIEQEKIENAKKIELEKIEKAKVEAEKKQEELRKKDLEDKYKKLEELSMKKATEKVATIGNPKFGEVSQSVRALQLTLKELWYFAEKDTAIYGNKTKDSIFAYQLSKKLVSKKDDLWAWMIWPRTLETIKNDLKQKFLNEYALNEWIKTKEVAFTLGKRL